MIQSDLHGNMQLTQMMIYGGGAWSYAHDSNFTHVSTSTKFWENVIEQYYAKYHGIRKGHDADIMYVKEHGCLHVPSGRYYRFQPEQKRGEWEWLIWLDVQY